MNKIDRGHFEAPEDKSKKLQESVIKSLRNEPKLDEQALKEQELQDSIVKSLSTPTPSEAPDRRRAKKPKTQDDLAQEGVVRRIRAETDINELSNPAVDLLHEVELERRAPASEEADKGNEAYLRTLQPDSLDTPLFVDHNKNAKKLEKYQTGRRTRVDSSINSKQEIEQLANEAKADVDLQKTQAAIKAGETPYVTAARLGREAGLSLEEFGETGDNAGKEASYVNTRGADKKNERRRYAGIRAQDELQVVQEGIAAGRTPDLTADLIGKRDGLSLDNLGETGANVGSQASHVDTRGARKSDINNRYADDRSSAAVNARLDAEMEGRADLQARAEDRKARRAAQEAEYALAGIHAQKAREVEAEANAEFNKIMAEKAAERKAEMQRRRDQLNAILDAIDAEKGAAAEKKDSRAG